MGRRPLTRIPRLPEDPQLDRTDPVETSRLKELIELMDRNQLEELEVVDGDQRIRLRKRPEKVREVVSLNPLQAPTGSVVPAPVEAPAMDAAAAFDPAKAIQSPMVGTFYRSSGPDAEPFVEVGDQVQEGQVLCIVEAMKVMNEVKADRTGVVESVLLDDGNPVEFGQPLFLFS